MNCANNCGEPIRPTEERDGIDRHDGKYEFGYVHDNGPEIPGDPFCDITLTATPPAVNDQELTDDDRFLIAEARRIGPALRVRISDQERLAGEVIVRLTDLAERLAGEQVTED